MTGNGSRAGSIPPMWRRPRPFSRSPTAISACGAALEEGRPTADDGTLVNGFFEFRPIVYPEEAYGFPREGQTILYVPESKIVRLYVDDEPVDLCSAHILSYRRMLDMRAGLLRRDVEYATALGKRVRVRSARIVSLRRRHLAAIDYEVRS
jgi:alpha,alpha-trehalose phosphorylase